MTITQVATSGPAAAASGALNVAWVTPAANNTAVLYILALSGQTIPTTLAGWTPDLAPTTIAGYVAASFKKTTAGSETGNQLVMTATTASIAWIREFNGSVVPPTATSSVGGDSNDGANGITTLSTTTLPSAVNDWIATNTVWASSTPSFPTAPVAVTSRAITQAGASLGTIQNRAGATWLTNHRYNISDISVTTGATAAPQYVSNTTTASLRGITIFTLLHEITVVPQTVVAPETSIAPAPQLPTLSGNTLITIATPPVTPTPVLPAYSAGSLQAAPVVLIPPTAQNATVVADTTTSVGKSITVIYNVFGTPLVSADLTLMWRVEAGVDDGDNPPPNTGDDPPPRPANEGLEYETPQPIPLALLQDSLESHTVTFYLTPETIPPSGDVTLDMHTDEPLTPVGVEKVWTEVPNGTIAGTPDQLAPQPAAPAEPSSNPEI